MIEESSVWIAVAYVTMSAGSLFLSDRVSPRAARLLIPLWINLLMASAFLLVLCIFPSVVASINPLGTVRQEIFVTLLLVGMFAFVVEVPGFLLNVQHDNKVVGVLDTLEQVVLSARIDPSAGMEQLRALTNSQGGILDSAGVRTLLANCVEVFTRMKNIDVPLLGILLEQVQQARSRVRERSKHPFPVLIQVLSLSGIGFILAEILAILRMR